MKVNSGFSRAGVSCSEYKFRTALECRWTLLSDFVVPRSVTLHPLRYSQICFGIEGRWRILIYLMTILSTGIHCGGRFT